MIRIKNRLDCRRFSCTVLLSCFWIFGCALSTLAIYIEQDVKIGQNVSIKCPFNSADIIWQRNNSPINLNTETKDFIITNINKKDETTNLTYIENLLWIKEVNISNKDIYTCTDAKSNDSIVSFKLHPYLTPQIVEKSPDTIKKRNGAHVTLFCVFEIFSKNHSIVNELKWLKDGQKLILDDAIQTKTINATHFNYTLHFSELYGNDSGSYECGLFSKSEGESVKKQTILLVMDVPRVSIDFAKAVGAHNIFLNWTSNDANDPIQMFFIQFSQEGSPTFTYYKDSIGGKNSSYILENLQANTTYYLRISGKNSIGSGNPLQYHNGVRTLIEDPIFIPNVETTGSTLSTITISWNPPPPDLLDYIHYYELVVSECGDIPKVIEEAVYQQNSRNLPYMFDNLKTATDYEFKVRACNELTKLCGPWSKTINGTTMDGPATEPTNLTVICVPHNIPRLNSIIVTWKLPNSPNGKVISYLISVRGVSAYRIDNKWTTEVWGPKIRRVDESQHKTVYEGVSPNTNYSVTVTAITRPKRTGLFAEGKCSMPSTVPDTIGRITWAKVKSDSRKLVLKMHLPAISERYGPICCYRFYLMRLQAPYKDQPTPDKLNISTYSNVHNVNNTESGTYLVEQLAGGMFQKELYLGDGKRFTDDSETIFENDEDCRKCLDTKKDEDVEKKMAQIPIEADLTTIIPVIKNASMKSEIGKSQIDAVRVTSGNSSSDDPFDGEIFCGSNYTGFLEIIVRDNYNLLRKYSDYFDLITPETRVESIPYFEDLVQFLYLAFDYLLKLVGAVLICLCVLWCFAFCFKNITGGGDQIGGAMGPLRLLLGIRNSNHSRFISTINHKGFEANPIPKNEIMQAYISRHKDTDYGFLREYEVLPNRFGDRTTKNSDMKENASKNRYPDIKAYDQTRVKLAMHDGVIGSDYINANFVIGYKERKKFICAQGPMESTIQDFWRMIWEQHLEIILMLTNLEEYNKSKCSKYWPDKLLDIKQYGDINVKFVEERKTGDYIIRVLDITKRNVNGDEEEHRNITQYHYLTWKDFMAPEYPHGIIRFIRKVNNIYSVQRGPILVHCSAGVGRTGTLVALDSLIQQLQEENVVSIFNTVCDLRHQRNFLVQSLKQYIFLYRALLDIATFGNTELPINYLSTAVENLKMKPADGKDKCKMEIEFEKMLSFCDETNKSCSIGQCEENGLKNRSEMVVPYDRNRVILNPIPQKDNSTYINASFIEGYDNSETFIITQDPLEYTIGDFWRMVSEQSVSTLVMISEVGEGPRKCPRYWADEEISYDHILVKYVRSESCPYYTRREFEVINCKIADTLTVTQFQYNGWPTVNGQVPEVCRGIIELVDQAYHHYTNQTFGCRSPLTVHCSLGTDRSSIFVAMCILVKQLRFEKSVDICSVARKLQSQRIGLVDTYAQYEFLHRAVVNYADLHNLTENSSN